MLINQSTVDNTSEKSTLSSLQHTEDASSSENNVAVGMSLVRRCNENEKIPKAASKYILRSWRSATQKQYNTYLKQWQIFCYTRGIHPISAPIEHALEFLAQLADRGLGYSAINTDRSALFATLVLPNGVMFGPHMYVKRLLKGVFETKPALPRYTVVWDIGVVHAYIKNLGPNKELTLK